MNTKIENLDVLMDMFRAKADLEFVYNNKNFSIVYPNGKILLLEQNTENEIEFETTQAFLDYVYEGKKMQDVILEAQIIFRCF